MRRFSIAITIVLLLATVFALGGCKKVEQVTSIWPTAERERSVTAPDASLVFPFRGTIAPDRKAVERRPLSVKIENSPASRPQTGLNSADVVYETISEGGITRFNCIFQSDIPRRIGPVRSARLSDLWVVPQYHALFFFSGANSAVNHAVNGAKLPNLSQDAGISAPYSRSSRPAPHNLYLNTEIAYRTAKSRGYAIVAPNLKGLQYERRSTESTPSVTVINVPFSPANHVRWEFHESTQRYSRFNNGAPHKDEGTGEQVTADNVVVLWAKYTAAAQRTKTGSPTFYITLGGKGKCSIFHNGRRYDGIWTADRNTPPRFKDKNGRSIRLARGRTWFQVVPTAVSISAK